MKSQPIVPARIQFGDGPPQAPAFADVYHPRAGALEQARHVFLAGNALPRRWQGQRRFVVLETGFGLGNNFLATWDAWRADPQRCGRLWFLSIEKHPPAHDDLARAHAGSPLPALTDQLVAAWPPLVPGLHTLAFEGGRVMLRLAFGDIAAWLPELVAEVDAYFLDGFAPARNPEMWQPRLFKAIARLAAPGATAATWSAARIVRDGLRSAGFEVEAAAGSGGKRDITRACYAPAYVPRRPPARVAQVEGRDVVVVGAGLAGAAAAHALRADGFEVEVLEAAAAPALGASGNPGGLFHGVVHGHDGPHARFYRAAALHAARRLRPWFDAGTLPGHADGLLRLAGDGDDSALASFALPSGYVQWLDATQAAKCSGWPLASPAWLFPQGGWVDPGALVRHLLGNVRCRYGQRVSALRRDGGRWQLLGDGGSALADASHVVLANAGDALRLLGQPWPVQRQRAQLTRLPPHTLPPPRLPLAGAGYALALPDGSLLCGAATRDAEDPDLSADDHRHNLGRLAMLAGPLPALDAGRLDGRVGWRISTIDRLPIIGTATAAMAAVTRADQARLMPREPGLHVLTALGSRGISAALLGGELLASWLGGAPFPLEASLVDALDPARFELRR